MTSIELIGANAAKSLLAPTLMLLNDKPEMASHFSIPCTLNPKPETRNPKSETLKPKLKPKYLTEDAPPPLQPLNPEP